MIRVRRVRWTDSMINDLLYCKREALIATRGTNPPMRHGKKVSYIDYMHILWVSLGYGKLGKSPSNLQSAAYNVQKKRSKSTKYNFSILERGYCTLS